MIIIRQNMRCPMDEGIACLNLWPQLLCRRYSFCQEPMEFIK
jgi:hypothetical protein